MTGLVIGGVLVLLIVLVFLWPLRLRVVAKDRYRITLWVLFLPIRLYDTKPNKKKKKAEKGKDEENKSASAVKSYLSDLVEEKGVRGAVKELWEILKEVTAPILPFVKQLKLKIRRLQIVVATGEADRTALEYGAVSGGVANVLARFGDRIAVPTKEPYGVFADFTSPKSRLCADVTVSAKPMSVLRLGTALIKVFLKRFKQPTSVNKGVSQNGGK